MMKLGKELIELIMSAEKVSENVSIFNEKGKSLVLSNSESIYFQGMDANGDKNEKSNFVLDKNVINLIKLTDVCEEILLEIKKDKIKFIGGSTEATLPTINEASKKLNISVESCSVVDVSEIKKVLYAVGTDSSRPILGGVSFQVIGENLELAACDGYRISSLTLPLSKFGKLKMLSEDLKFIVAKTDINRLLQIMKGSAGIAYDEEKNIVTFIQSKSMVSIKCMDGQFIDYNRILNDANTPYNFSVDKDSLLKELQKCGLTNNSQVTLKISKDGLKVFSKSESLEVEGKLRLGMDSIVEEVEITFNLKYLLEVIHAVDDEDEIVINYKDAKSLIKRDTENFRNMLLPVVKTI